MQQNISPWPNSNRNSLPWTLTFGLPYPFSHHPILAEILLNWFSQNPPSFIPIHHQYTTWFLITLSIFSKNPVWSDQPEFLLGYRFPLFLLVFRIKPIFPSIKNPVVVVLIGSPWVKSALLSLKSVRNHYFIINGKEGVLSELRGFGDCEEGTPVISGNGEETAWPLPLPSLQSPAGSRHWVNPKESQPIREPVETVTGSCVWGVNEEQLA